MSIYQRFCRETVDESGCLKNICLDYPDNFNFGYDVVDAIADETPDKTALVWCNTENEEHIFSFAELKILSNKTANVFQNAGLKRGDRVMVLLKRHYEYWVTAIALHKLGITMIPATHMLTADDLVYRITSADVDAIVCTPQNDVPDKVKEALKKADASCKLWSVQTDIDGFENLSDAIDSASDKFERVPTQVTVPMLLYLIVGICLFVIYPLSKKKVAENTAILKEKRGE